MIPLHEDTKDKPLIHKGRDEHMHPYAFGNSYNLRDLSLNPSIVVKAYSTPESAGLQYSVKLERCNRAHSGG